MHSSIRLLTGCVAVILMLLPMSAHGANEWADHTNITVKNATNYESYVDFSRLGLHWVILKAICVGPRGAYTFSDHWAQRDGRVPEQIRIRTEVKLHGCNSGTHGTPTTETGDIRRGAENFVITLEEKPAGHFFLVKENPR